MLDVSLDHVIGENDFETDEKKENAMVEPLLGAEHRIDHHSEIVQHEGGDVATGI
jgi:hypothetical protein